LNAEYVLVFSFISFNVEPQVRFPFKYLDKFRTRIILLKILDEIRALKRFESRENLKAENYFLSSREMHGWGERGRVGEWGRKE
jgi:hypothetical protein